MSYEFPAWCQMETALDSYHQERQKYLESEAKKLGQDGQSQLQDFTEAADSLVKGVQELTGDDGVSSLKDLLKAAGSVHAEPLELLDEHVCITFGWEAMGMLVHCHTSNLGCCRRPVLVDSV